MNPTVFWRKQKKETQVIIISLFATCLVFFLLGLLAGKIVGSNGTGKIKKADVETERVQLFVEKKYPNIDKNPSGIFWLGNRDGYQAVLGEGEVIYLKKGTPKTVESLNRSEKIITIKGRRDDVARVFSAIGPNKKIGPGKYKNSQGFIWIKKKGRYFYLIRSENIKQYPGEVK